MKKYIFVLTFFLFIVYGIFAIPKTDKNFIVQVSGEAVVNPHKGFVQYVNGNNYIDNIWWELALTSGQNESWNYCSVVYTGCGWNKIQKGKNEYDWSFIDDQLESCGKYGKTLGWRIYPIDGSFSDGDLVPDFIYKEGCKSVESRVKGAGYKIRVPDWSDPIYIQACKDFAKAMADRYDGDKRVEFIDVRCFGNWGEWHCFQFEDSEMPSEEIQKEMLEYYASVFKKTLLIVPSDCSGAVYDFAVSLGIAKRNDGLIQIKDREKDLYKCYKAGLPATGENCDTYTNMLKQTDSDSWSQKWTLKRWKNVINVSHMTYYELDRGDVGKTFFNDNATAVKEMTNKLGYNFEVTSANLKYDVAGKTTLNVKIKNTGLAPAFFDLNLIAEVTDSNGNRKKSIGDFILIKKGTFADGSEMTYVFTANNISLNEGDSICLGLYEDPESENPTVKFDNKNTLKNNKLRLGEF
jgi:hypothetical protein